jgi:hypothetical protein
MRGMGVEYTSIVIMYVGLVEKEGMDIQTGSELFRMGSSGELSWQL